MARSSLTVEPKAASRGRSSAWILGRGPDLLLVIASPLFVIAALTVARGIWSGAAISSFVMIWAIGHHLPGMMRAYGDPELFRRFRLRFILAPTLLLAACSFAFYFHINSGVLAIASVWGWWHYLMQAYGFCRIYDAKVGSFAATTRWLDQAMCVCWFAAAVILNDNALYAFVENFHKSGLPIPSEAFFGTVRSATQALTIGVTVLFVGNHLQRLQSGQRPSLLKVVLMISTFACFWYSAATVTNIVVAYAFFELFHDIQYLTIVWAFNRNRVRKDDSLQGFTRWLFQPRVMLIVVYLALVMGYGSLKYGSTRITDEQWQSILAAVFLTSTLLHYYFDGFIWKLREAGNRSSLELRAHATSPAQPWSVPPRLRHALLWCLFVVPFGALLVTQAQQRINLQNMDNATKVQTVIQDSERLARVAPNSYMAQYTLAASYEMTGQPERAIESYRRVLAANPDYTPAQEALARLESR